MGFPGKLERQAVVVRNEVSRGAAKAGSLAGGLKGLNLSPSYPGAGDRGGADGCWTPD